MKMDDDMKEPAAAARRGREARFTISIAAEMVNVHAQTLRHYERIGLIAPQRSEGKIRLYTLEDIELLDAIKTLIEDKRVNLAGVQAVLELRDEMNEIRAAWAHERLQMEQTHQAEIARLKAIIRRMNGQEAPSH